MIRFAVRADCWAPNIQAPKWQVAGAAVVRLPHNTASMSVFMPEP
jgi:hypothetical protein